MGGGCATAHANNGKKRKEGARNQASNELCNSREEGGGRLTPLEVRACKQDGGMWAKDLSKKKRVFKGGGSRW